VTKVNWNSTTQGEAVAGGLAFSAGDGQTVYNVKAAREVILSCVFLFKRRYWRHI
jgi:hypothetical protein